MEIPRQSNGNGGEVRSEQFLYSSPGVNPLVKPSDFTSLNSDMSSNAPFNPASVQEK